MSNGSITQGNGENIQYQVCLYMSGIQTRSVGGYSTFVLCFEHSGDIKVENVTLWGIWFLNIVV